MIQAIKLRLGFVYLSMFAFIGIHMPFWPVWLQSKGITPSQIAVLTALAFALKIIFTPIVSKIVDRNGRKREAIILLSSGMLIGCSLFFIVDGFWAIFALTTFTFACWSPIMSLCESVSTLAARSHQLDYGKIRLWGSVGFMIVAVTAGKLLGLFGGPSLLWFITGAAALVFTAACLLPPNQATPAKDKVSGSVFFTSRWFVLFLFSTTLIQGSHAVYYTFGTLYWQAQGLSDGSIGLLWGASLAIEIAFFAFGRSLIGKVGAVNTIVLGGVAAAARWAFIGSTGNFGVLMLVQGLHALSFGASHLAAMKIITDRVDPALSATGQGMYSAFIMGIGMGAFVLLSGPLYTALNGQAFLVMALVSLTGAGLALLVRRLDLTYISASGSPLAATKPAALSPAMHIAK